MDEHTPEEIELHNNEKYIKNMAETLKGSGKTFAEFLAETLKDKYVEIYLGDSYEEVSTEQISTSYPAVFCGKVVTAYKECLVINCAFINASKKLQHGNLLFINERAIRALNIIDGFGVLQDMFWRSSESTNMLKFVGKK